MIRRRATVAALTTAVLAASVMLAPGCQKSWGEEKKAQRNKYYNMRSGLMLEMAESHFAAGQLDTAEKTVRDAARIQPDNPRLHLMAGRIALERGKLERAITHFNKCLGIYAQAVEDGQTVQGKQVAEPHFYKGVVLQRWQRWQNAYDSYEQALNLEKDNSGHLIAMSEMLVPMDRIDEAIALLEDKVIYFDQSAAVRSSLAHLYRIKGDHLKAAQLFKEAAVLAPTDLKLREELAVSQSASDQHQDAAATLTELLSHREMQGRVDLHRKLAHIQIAAGQLNSARQTLIELTRRDAATADDWVHLAKLAWKDGDLGATLFAAHKVTRLAPDQAEGYLLAGMVWQKRGHIENALRMFDRAAELDDTDPTPLVLRGMTLQNAGKPGAAADAYDRALQRQPNHPHARRLLAAVRPE